MDWHEAIRICFKNNVKVYPIYKFRKWFIECDINGKIKSFPKPLKSNEIDNAMKKTYIFLAEKL